MSKLGLVHVITGDGKGKTTASMGLAVRAIGQGFKACVIQVLKGGGYTGEMVAALNYLPNFKFYQFGKGCIKQARQMKIQSYSDGQEQTIQIRDDIDCGHCRYCFIIDIPHKNLVRDAYMKSKEVIEKGEYDVVVLDEMNVAVQLGLISASEVCELIKLKPEHTELIITGRGAPQEVKDAADYVSEIKEIKHPWQQNISARRGIEY